MSFVCHLVPLAIYGSLHVWKGALYCWIRNVSEMEVGEQSMIRIKISVCLSDQAFTYEIPSQVGLGDLLV